MSIPPGQATAGSINRSKEVKMNKASLAVLISFSALTGAAYAQTDNGITMSTDPQKAAEIEQHAQEVQSHEQAEQQPSEMHMQMKHHPWVRKHHPVHGKAARKAAKGAEGAEAPADQPADKPAQ